MDHRSDIFSFGVAMYEMATGVVAFKGKSQAETMNAVINESHRPVAELNKEVPPQLAAVIDRALAKEARDRYQTMTELEEQLRQVAQAEGATDSGVPYISSRRDSWMRQSWPANRLTWLLALTVASRVQPASTTSPWFTKDAMLLNSRRNARFPA